MSIELKNVTYTYSPGTAYEIHALKDVNLSIPDGQFIGIIGHTGSGKSTLIQHFNALIRPTSGTITYNGEDIWGEKYDRRALRSEVGLVFQYPEHQLFENDVLSDVCFGPMNQGLSREEPKLSYIIKPRSCVTLCHLASSIGQVHEMAARRPTYSDTACIINSSISLRMFSGYW